MKLNARSIAALASIAFSVASASAQSMPSSPYLSVAQRSAFLLANPFEIKKIDLSANQLQSVKKELANYAAKQRKLLASKNPSEKDQEALDMAYANGCLKLLTPAQADKLLSIGVKQIGTDALKDPAICSKVGLGAVQVHKIKEIVGDYNKHAEDVEAMIGAAIEKIPEPKPGADRKGYDQKQKEVYDSYQGERMLLEKKRAEADKDILALMSANQREKWVALVGKTDDKSSKH